MSLDDCRMCAAPFTVPLGHRRVKLIKLTPVVKLKKLNKKLKMYYMFIARSTL